MTGRQSGRERDDASRDGDGSEGVRTEHERGYRDAVMGSPATLSHAPANRNTTSGLVRGPARCDRRGAGACSRHPPPLRSRPRMRFPVRSASRLALSLCIAGALSAQQPAAPKYDRTAYAHTSADIPMRDGLTLHVEIFAPRNATEPLPFLFERTPYGVA